MTSFLKAFMLQIITKVVEIQRLIHQERNSGAKIGFVPTMGALHAGHLSLIERSRTENQITVCSIFVNPTQFNDKADFSRYPRTIESDSAILQSSGCQFLFLPDIEEIYPTESSKTIDFTVGTLGDVLEGVHRPGHFNGMATVVKRLFDIVKPDKAYFGNKDFQQFLIVKKLVLDCHIPVEVIPCPTLREADGLAMSSRNALLSAEQRLEATFLYQMLQKAKDLILTQSHKRQDIINIILRDFLANGNFTVDYFDICSVETLQPLEDFANKEIVICVAAYLGKIRLIDNILLNTAE